MLQITSNLQLSPFRKLILLGNVQTEIYFPVSLRLNEITSAVPQQPVEEVRVDESGTVKMKPGWSNQCTSNEVFLRFAPIFSILEEERRKGKRGILISFFSREREACILGRNL